MKKIYIRPVSENYTTELGQMICASAKGYGYTSDPESSYNMEDPQLSGTETPVIEIDGPGGPGSSAKEFDLWGDW